MRLAIILVLWHFSGIALQRYKLRACIVIQGSPSLWVLNFIFFSRGLKDDKDLCSDIQPLSFGVCKALQANFLRGNLEPVLCLVSGSLVCVSLLLGPGSFSPSCLCNLEHQSSLLSPVSFPKALLTSLYLSNYFLPGWSVSFFIHK